MKIHFLIIFILLIFGTRGLAQISFKKDFSGYTGGIYDVKQTSDDGYVLTSGTVSSDVYLIKTDTLGDTLWTRTFGGSGTDFGVSVQQTNDHGYIIGGTTNSFGSGNSDFYLIKTDSIGNLIWSKTIGGSGEDSIKSVQQTTDGGYILAGFTGSFGLAARSMYVVKTDSAGVIQWTKIFGGVIENKAYSIQQTNDGGYILSGTSNSLFLIKANSVGDTLWTKSYWVGAGSITGGWARQTLDGGYIVCGTYNSSTFLSCYFKTSANGNVEWAHQIWVSSGPGQVMYNYISHIQPTLDKGYLFIRTEMAHYACSGGVFCPDNDYSVYKADSLGNTIWRSPYIGNDYAVFSQTKDSGFVLLESAGTSLRLIRTNKIFQTTCTARGTIAAGGSFPVNSSGTSFTISTGGLSTNAPTQIGKWAGNITTICTSVVGMEDYSLSSIISLFPNPSGTDISLNISGLRNYQNSMIIIQNALGEVVKKIVNTKNIDVSELEGGCYFLEVITLSDGQTYKTKFIKQ